MIKCLEACNVSEGMKIIQSIVEQGMDVKQFIIQLTNTIHGLLLQKVGVEQVTSYKLQVTSLSIDELRDLLVLFNKAYNEMKYAVLPQLPLELAIIEWSGLLKKNTEDKKDLRSKIQDSDEKQDTRKSAPESVKITNKDITVTTLRKQEFSCGERGSPLAIRQLAESGLCEGARECFAIVELSLNVTMARASSAAKMEK